MLRVARGGEGRITVKLVWSGMCGIRSKMSANGVIKMPSRTGSHRKLREKRKRKCQRMQTKPGEHHAF